MSGEAGTAGEGGEAGAAGEGGEAGGEAGTAGAGGEAGTAGEGGTGGSTAGSSACGATEKLCDGNCVSDNDPATGCSATDCAPCDFTNATSTCSAGACAIKECKPGFANCDGDAANGCEADLASTETCGGCGKACSLPNAAAVCSDGACGLGACTDDFQDCDGNPENGCEAVVKVDPENCGACGNACKPGEQCENGVCGVYCPDGKANCDDDATNACEVTLGTIDDCGFCGDACKPANAAGACAEGACTIDKCDEGFADCNGVTADGCETDTRTATSDCGACGTICPKGPNSTAVCQAGVCKLDCKAGYADCDGDPTNGCEQSTQDDLQNCGECNNACSTQNGTPSCVSGQCQIASCSAPFANCNQSPLDGCEANTQSSLTDCGSCGNACPEEISNGAAQCATGTCVAVCAMPFANCDQDLQNGCEINTLIDATHCGGCDNFCMLANATPACIAGTCAIDTCNEGFADCDGDPANGCEVDTRTSVLDCGQCGTACMTANGTPACVDGACVIDLCTSGYLDCDGSPASGCEVNSNIDVNHCGTCDTQCNTANATPACVAGACAIDTCNEGFADCDGDPANGCEVNTLTDVSNCGTCGNNCSTVCTGNVATTSCNAGSCGITTCAANHMNLDGDCPNGCECQSLQSGSSTCITALSLGTLAIGQSTSVTYNLPSTGEIWLQLTFTYNTNTSYHPSVKFTSNANNEFIFDVLSNCSGSALACGVEGGNSSNKTGWEVSYTAGDPNNSAAFNPIPAVGNNGTVLIRVRRANGPVSCNSFTLLMSN